jgi:hypothetical protein
MRPSLKLFKSVELQVQIDKRYLFLCKRIAVHIFVSHNVFEGIKVILLTEEPLSPTMAKAIGIDTETTRLEITRNKIEVFFACLLYYISF